MTTQPEALRLADALDKRQQHRYAIYLSETDTSPEAAELRRLHEVNQELLAALREVVAYCVENGHDWMCMVQARAAIAKAERTTT